ncbi:PLP-dependent aminotransferase family protein [Streptomyces radiopugnans]|uniref:GntR family transcriptional regulator / MocR family aminotransferase n=1 Tax=Streptomyces radiopugnans TaxID=403935 RepID=A0A1H9HW26_9ACTN|nr:PLP-dependent aminotransferase family protein [Streptomyces radiopugnans]SEQ66559.1 GntR family transcriptional regulator / MocR family aminotransferase [Streptomyces radiopugnans]
MRDSWANSVGNSDGGSGGRPDGGPNRGARGGSAGGAGGDLHLDLGGPGGLRASLMRALRDAVRTGRLAPGTRLPSSRSLAADLGVARNTVADAYAELVAEGWLAARQGSGTRVASRAEPAAPGGPPGAPPAVPRQSPRPAAPARTPPRILHDLRSGRPDVSAFPRAAWLTSARRALAAAPSAALGYDDPRGRPELRRALAGYLSRARGVRADPERIVVCAGFVRGLALLGEVLGTAVAVESYGLWIHRDLLTRVGARTVPLPVDDRGADVSALYTSGARAALLTPAHQYPTGTPLHPDRRTAAVDWARATGGLVLEDDYDGEFRYDRQPVGALQGLDPERVVYLGTASKSLAPGLRLGWMVVPESLLGPVLAVRRETVETCGALDQLTLADFVDSGAYDRHVRAMRLRYRRRRDQLVAALAEHAPAVRVTGIAAGLHAVLELPPGTEGPVLEEAGRAGVAVEGLARFRHPAAPEPGAGRPGSGREWSRPGRDALVVGYGTPPEHGFSSAVEALCAVLRRVLGGRRAG